jgi:hypothetical protein
MEENVKFKVVTTNGRWSTMTAITMERKGRYVLQYPKGAIVKARPNTVGIMVFKDYRRAESFLKSMRMTGILKIIRVKPIGICYIPSRISSGCHDAAIYGFYADEYTVHKAGITPPTGTECYDAVEVLE